MTRSKLKPRLDILKRFHERTLLHKSEYTQRPFLSTVANTTGYPPPHLYIFWLQ